MKLKSNFLALALSLAFADVAGAEREHVGDLAAVRIDHAHLIAAVKREGMPLAGGDGDRGGGVHGCFG